MMFKSDLGNEFFGKKGEKLSEEKPELKENPKPKPKPKPFHCEHCERDGHLAEFCFRRKFKMEDSKAMATPMSTTTTLNADEEGEHVDQEYRSIIGSLLHMTVTRPDMKDQMATREGGVNRSR
jgi:hypothetical protein